MSSSKTYSYSNYGYDGYRRERRPRQLNRRLLTVTLLILAVGIPGVYFWHQHQLRRLCASLLTYADRMESEQRWDNAANALYRYWRIRPEAEVVGRLAVAYDHAAVRRDRPGVVSSYQRAVGLLPQRWDLRNRLAELLVQEGLHDQAMEQVEKVLAHDPESDPAWKSKALASLGRFRQGHPVASEDVLVMLGNALERQPHDFELAWALTEIIRGDMQAVSGSKLARQADQTMDRLVATAPGDAYGYLTRYRYREKYQLPGAHLDIGRALDLAPDDPAVVGQAAWDAHQDRDWLTARALFRRLVELNAAYAGGYIGLGDVEFFANRPQQALAVWEQGRRQSKVTLPLLLRIAEAQIQVGRLPDARQTLEEINTWRGSSASAENNRSWAIAASSLLWGRWHLARHEPRSAIPCLRTASLMGTEETTHDLHSRPIAFTAFSLLGDTFAGLVQWEDAATSFEQALQIQGDSARMMISAAEAWGQLGQLDRANQLASQALRQPNPPQQAPLRLAQFAFAKQLRLPTWGRDWSDFETSLKSARVRLPDSWELQLLEVDYRLLRTGSTREHSQALGILWSVEQSHPHDTSLWQRLPWVYESLGQREEADRALGRWDELSSSSPAAKILLADILMGRGEADAAQRVLGGLDPTRITPAERQQLDFALLRLVEFKGDRDEIEARLLVLSAKYSRQTTPLELLLDRRFASAESAVEPTTESLIEQLKQRQGETQSGWQYYAARQELEMASGGTLTRAISHLRDLENKRPHWSKTKELAGRIALARGNDGEATLAFENALQTSGDGSQTYRLLLRKYVSDGNYQAVWRLMERWAQSSPGWELADGRWRGFQQRLATSRALTAAGAAPGPAFESVIERILTERDAANMLWLTMLLRNDHRHAADTLLTSYQHRFPKDLSTWMVQLKDDVDAGDDPQEMLERIESLKLDDAGLQSFVLGQAWQLTGQLEKSREAYLKVDDRSPYRLAAEMYGAAVANQLDAADVETLAVEDHPPAQEIEARSQSRLEAVVKLRRAGTNDLMDARNLLQDLIDIKPEPTDRMLLAQCHEKLGDVAAAGEQLRIVVTDDPSAHHLAVYVDFLLRGGDADAATPWLKRLQQQAPLTPRSVALKVRWLDQQNREGEIKPLVESFARQQIEVGAEQDLPQQMQEVAIMYQSVGMQLDAERWLSMLATRFPDRANSMALLLMEGDATERAVRLCIERLQTNPSPQTAALLARVLVYGEVSEETRKQVMPYLDDSQSKFPDNGSLLFALGNLRLKMGSVSEAVELLQRVTEVQPSHYLAWNNLAALLAEKADRKHEAMERIEQAIQAAGYDIPTLLDTKAVVLIHQDRFEEAAELLGNVTESRLANDPRFFFHRALALEQLARDKDAMDSLTEAEDLGLATAFLTEYEREQLARLTEKYDHTGPEQP